MTDNRVGLIPIADHQSDIGLAEKLTKSFRTNLIFNGLRVIGGGNLITAVSDLTLVIEELKKEAFDVLLVFQATYTDHTIVTYLVEAIDQPIFLWAIPEDLDEGNLRRTSLTGLNLAANSLKLQNKPYWYVYADITDTPAFQKVRSVAASVKAARQLQRARVGVVRESRNEADPSNREFLDLEARFGVRLVHIETSALAEQIREVNPQKISLVLQQLEKRLGNLATLEPAAVNRTIGLYLVLKEIAKEKQLDGFALKCSSEIFTNIGCSACGAISLLIENGIPSSCEVDINGTLADLILNWLSGSPAVGVSIVSANFDEGQFSVWNCGHTPLSLADPTVQPLGKKHPDHGLPLTMAFPLKMGKVTVALLSRATGDYRLVIANGEMRSAPISFTGTSGLLRFENSSQEVLDTILEGGLEPRISLTYGSVRDGLLNLAKIINIPVLQL